MFSLFTHISCQDRKVIALTGNSLVLNKYTRKPTSNLFSPMSTLETSSLRLNLNNSLPSATVTSQSIKKSLIVLNRLNYIVLIAIV